MDEKKPVIVRAKGRVDVPDMNILFGPGENEVTDPDIMRVMLRFPMPLEFNPQDMVDLGYLTAAEVVSFGYEAFDREAGEVISGPVTADIPTPEGRPNFRRMGMPELKLWAQEHDVVLKLAPPDSWDSAACAEACEKKADEMKLPRKTKILMKPPPEPIEEERPEPEPEPKPKPPKKSMKKKKGKGK